MADRLQDALKPLLSLEEELLAEIKTAETSLAELELKQENIEVSLGKRREELKGVQSALKGFSKPEVGAPSILEETVSDVSSVVSAENIDDIKEADIDVDDTEVPLTGAEITANDPPETNKYSVESGDDAGGAEGAEGDGIETDGDVTDLRKYSKAVKKDDGMRVERIIVDNTSESTPESTPESNPRINSPKPTVAKIESASVLEFDERDWRKVIRSLFKTHKILSMVQVKRHIMDDEKCPSYEDNRETIMNQFKKLIRQQYIKKVQGKKKDYELVI